MKTLLITALLGVISTSAFAQEGATTGMVGGAATGALVGGPVGAGVGAVVGAIAGGALEPPPETVVTYVQQQPLQQSVVIEQTVAVGQPLPRDVVLVPVQKDPRYAYATVNEQRVIVDPSNYTVVQVLQ